MGKRPAGSFDDLVRQVVDAWRKRESTAGASAIAAGEQAHRAIRFRLKSVTDSGARRDCRAESVETIAAELQRAGFKVTAAEVNRTIRIFAVGQLYGRDARQLPLCVLRAFTATVTRNARKEEWNIKKPLADQAQQLFRSAVSGETDTTSVLDAMGDLVGRKQPAPRPKISAFERAVKTASKLSLEEQARVAHALLKAMPEELRNKVIRVTRQKVADQAPATVPMQPDVLPLSEAVEVSQTEEQSKPGLLRRLTG